jgi:Icc-related predicted phosphoesterase
LQNLPDADIVVHSGDICMVGSEQEAIDFLNWFCDLPYKHKIFIAGNHDECLYGANIGGLDANCHYLCNSGIEIEGLNFYGVPMFMNDCVYGKQQKNYDKIPDDTDVLITHTPPFGILDFDDNINYGAEELLPIVTRVHPQAHLFGHIHVQHGVKQQEGIIFSNGAIMNSDYTDFNEPNVIEI